MQLRRYYYIVVVSVVVIIGVGIGYFYLFDYSYRTILLVVRHAEKADASPNPNLSQDGLDRAQALVGVADEAAVAGIYSTEFCRTVQTAQILADALGLPINVQQDSDPDSDNLQNCNPPITVPINMLPVENDTTMELVDYVLAEHSSQVVLIVGHSDTVPVLVQELGKQSFSPIQIANEFDNLFIVTVPRFWHRWSTPKLVKAQYGN